MDRVSFYLILACIFLRQDAVAVDVDGLNGDGNEHSDTRQVVHRIRGAGADNYYLHNSGGEKEALQMKAAERVKPTSRMRDDRDGAQDGDGRNHRDLQQYVFVRTNNGGGGGFRGRSGVGMRWMRMAANRQNNNYQKTMRWMKNANGNGAKDIGNRIVRVCIMNRWIVPSNDNYSSSCI